MKVGIKMKVTIWWLIDHFFAKYWKWLLGGLGTVFITVFGWSWKKRFGQPAKVEGEMLTLFEHGIFFSDEV